MQIYSASLDYTVDRKIFVGWGTLSVGIDRGNCVKSQSPNPGKGLMVAEVHHCLYTIQMHVRILNIKVWPYMPR